ncbi:hypothetical protein [Streptomyces olivochromogenes]|uniref:hypothetical protein n=1 Tax=Streptomyces olivochromogenes TaxID=1963 RepID=UPI001912ADB4|nr:hypothetical protein [Streptomyces olivochromogenes]
MSDVGKDIEILTLCHQLAVVQRQIDRPRVTSAIEVMPLDGRPGSTEALDDRSRCHKKESARARVSEACLNVCRDSVIFAGEVPAPRSWSAPATRTWTPGR